MAFCQSCGAEVLPQAIVCVKCGAGIPHAGAVTSGQIGPVSEKSWVATLLLCFFLGWCGAHRFYTGLSGLTPALPSRFYTGSTPGHPTCTRATRAAPSVTRRGPRHGM